MRLSSQDFQVLLGGADPRPASMVPPATTTSSCSRVPSAPVTTTLMCPATAGVRNTSPGTTRAVTRLSRRCSLAAVAADQLGAEQPQAHLHEAVT